MGISFFGKRKTSRRTKQKGADKVARELIKDKINQNPVIEAAVLSKHFGVPINPNDLKPEPPVERLRKKVFDLANESLVTNEENKERAIDAAFQELEGTSQFPGNRKRIPYWRRGVGKGKELDDEFMEQYPTGSPLEETLNTMDILEERFGKRQPGFIDAMLQPGGVGTELVKLLTTAMTAKGSSQAPTNGTPMLPPTGREMIAVEVDGKLVEMSREGSSIYKRQREDLQRLKAGTSNTSNVAIESKTTETKTTEDSVPTSQVQSPIENIGQASPNVESTFPPPLKSYIESHISAFTDVGQIIIDEIAHPPEQFADIIKQLAQSGDMTFVVILEYLKTHTADQILQMLDMLKQYPELSPYIQKTKDNRNWVEAVLENLK